MWVSSSIQIPQKVSVQFCLPPSHVASDFTRFISKPENVENSAKILSAFCIYSAHLLKTTLHRLHIVQFLYFPRGHFLLSNNIILLMFLHCFISVASSSLARTNASGEKGQPWRIPSSTANTREKRNLSIAGKVCIIKIFLISQFVCIMQVLVVPDPVLTQVSRILFRFLWCKKDCNRKAFEKLKRTVVL